MSRIVSVNPLRDCVPNLVSSYPYFDVYSQILINVPRIQLYTCTKYSYSFYASMCVNTHVMKHIPPFLISNFRHVLNVVCFLLGNSPASEFYMSTFRNTLFHLHRQVDTCLPMKMLQIVPKRRHIKLSRQKITQKKAYNIPL